MTALTIQMDFMCKYSILPTNKSLGWLWLMLPGLPRAPVEREFRSFMNVPLRIGGPNGNNDLEKKFLDDAHMSGMIQLKGHRSASTCLFGRYR